MAEKVLKIILMFFIINSVNAQEYGLLLGLRYGANYNSAAQLAEGKEAKKTSGEIARQGPSLYRTLWIRANEGQIGWADLIFVMEKKLVRNRHTLLPGFERGLVDPVKAGRVCRSSPDRPPVPHDHSRGQP